jgi:hypothetical protein
MKISPDLGEDFEPHKKPLMALETAFKEAASGSILKAVVCMNGNG